MERMEAIRARHAVRAYTDQPIEGKALEALRAEIDACNRESGLHIQLITGEPDAFGGFMARYGKFSNVRNYIALVGKKGPGLDESVGYYGQRVAMSFRKRKSRCVVEPGEKLVCVLALGYGCTQGAPHKSRHMEELCQVEGQMPDWVRRGMAAAMLAPTAMNQQKFRLTLTENGVEAKSTGGFYSKVDLGIVKYHFEVGAAPQQVNWV